MKLCNGKGDWFKSGKSRHGFIRKRENGGNVNGGSKNDGNAKRRDQKIRRKPWMKDVETKKRNI